MNYISTLEQYCLDIQNLYQRKGVITTVEFKIGRVSPNPDHHRYVGSVIVDNKRILSEGLYLTDDMNVIQASQIIAKNLIFNLILLGFDHCVKASSEIPKNI